MNRYEYSADPVEAMLAVARSALAHTWTAMPAVIEFVDLTKMTVKARPAIQSLVTKIDSSTEWLTMPLLHDCPIVFPGGGGFTLTFPVEVGDECLLVFASRCIDGWWSAGGVQPQTDLRMHDISDGFALVGVRNVTRALPAISGTDVTLRSDDGVAKIAIAPDHRIKIETTANVEMTAPTVAITGDLTVTGSVQATGDVTGAGKSLSTHKHGGVQTGAGQTGTPA